MKLVTRLLLSHAGLAAILSGALALSLTSISRMDALMQDLRERELGSLDDEEVLYRAGWAIEVAARHAILACEAGASDADVVPPLVTRLASLRETERRVGARAPRGIRNAVNGYGAFAGRVIERDSCARLRSSEGHQVRIRLDEDLTNAWIGRLYDLHRAIYAKEERTRRTGDYALATGGTLGVLALVGSALLARHIARGVTEPLGALARAARRVGRGDFSPVPLASGPAEVVDLSRDLDRMREHLAELDSLKQGFIASVSHELRTPLAKLREALSLLGDGATGPLGERQTRVVAIARSACEAQIRLVTTLLDLSRLRAGNPLKLAPDGSIDAVLRDAIAAEAVASEGAGVAVELDLRGPAPAALLDGPLLERAVANLVRNAVSVSPRGERVTVVRTVASERPGGGRGRWARIEVSDRGPGVAPEVRDGLFEAFVTHAPPGQPGRVGVGLGLTLARDVARAHGGDLELSTDTSSGATFVLWIPLDGQRAKSIPPDRGAVPQ